MTTRRRKRRVVPILPNTWSDTRPSKKVLMSSKKTRRISSNYKLKHAHVPMIVSARVCARVGCSIVLPPRLVTLISSRRSFSLLIYVYVCVCVCACACASIAAVMAQLDKIMESTNKNGARIKKTLDEIKNENQALKKEKVRTANSHTPRTPPSNQFIFTNSSL